MSTDIGEKIRGIREAEGLSRKAFAEAAGINARSLERIENGGSCSKENLLAVIKRFPNYAAWLAGADMSNEIVQTTPEIEATRDRLKPTGTDTKSRSE
ncbi:helix-turn-helix transcriptional regulator [uncultured Salinicola sp.]|uniref:helix-turn-helix transcriptional regulator n=1 Tax=uncultured Salinicola sp. TaxID=1193542 RepID=UPI00260473BF|nr:helix-turn-helix transcriptional regulator [uncultured Salinicola sp.]